MATILFWVIVSLGALVIDIATSSFFFAGLTVGGIFALIAGILDYNLLIQFIVFGIVSAVSIAVEYEWLRKRLKKSIRKTLKMEEEYIGRNIVAEEDINSIGRAKIGGIYWTVENSGEPVKKGESARIIGIKGNKFIIKK
jgi:membrane protein implicated in regulation of membrane protease activity